MLESTQCIPQCQQTCLQQCGINPIIDSQCQSACQTICQQNCGHHQYHPYQQQLSASSLSPQQQQMLKQCQQTGMIQCYCPDGNTPCDNGSHCCKKR